MIKGKGYELNFNSISEDIEGLISLKRNIANIKVQLQSIHNIYQGIYSTCPMPEIALDEDLESCYVALSEKLKELYYEPVSSNFCCYCGKNEPDRLDHFHPSSKAPQYSLLRFNLIRSCVKCNEHKSSRAPISVLNLFHPYFCEVFDRHDCLFEAVLKQVRLGTDGKLIFDIDVLPILSLSDDEKRRVVLVLKDLKIAKRVAKRVAIKLTNIVNDWSSYGVNMQRRDEFSYLANRARRELNYGDYFSYSILAEIENYRAIETVIPRAG